MSTNFGLAGIPGTRLKVCGGGGWWSGLNKVAFEGGGPPLKLGKVNDKLTRLGKNNDKNKVYPPYLEAFWAKQRVNLGKNYENQGYPPYLEAFGGTPASSTSMIISNLLALNASSNCSSQWNLVEGLSNGLKGAMTLDMENL